MKHSFEKVGDHWEPKQQKRPSDAKAAGGHGTDAETAGGVDASKQHLMTWRGGWTSAAAPG